MFSRTDEVQAVDHFKRPDLKIGMWKLIGLQCIHNILDKELNGTKLKVGKKKGL